MAGAQYGLDNLWAIHRGEVRPFRAMLRWYTDLRRAGRAIVMQLVLQVVSAAEQNNIMQAICRDVTRYSGERAMVFALPVCAAVGLRQLDDFDL